MLVPLRIPQQPGSLPSSLNYRTAEARHARARGVPRSLQVSGRPLVPKQCLCATWPQRPQHRARVSTALMAHGVPAAVPTPAGCRCSERLASLVCGPVYEGQRLPGGKQAAGRARLPVSPLSLDPWQEGRCHQRHQRHMPGTHAASQRAGTRLQGAHSPPLSNMQEGQRTGGRGQLRPQPPALSPGPARTPGVGGTGPRWGPAGERQHRRCFPHQKKPLLIGGCRWSIQNSARRTRGGDRDLGEPRAPSLLKASARRERWGLPPLSS